MAGIVTKDQLSGVITDHTLGAQDIFKNIVDESLVLSRGNNIGAMPKGKTNIPIPKTLISANFVGMGEKKPVTDTSIRTETLNAGKVAAVVLIPEELLEDADFDVFENFVKPQAPRAFGEAIDRAVLFGAGKPAEWTGFQSGLVPQAIAKGMGVNLTSDLYADIMGRNGMISKVNMNGFSVNGWAGDPLTEALLREARDGDGRPLYNPFLDPISGEPREAIYGKPYRSLLNGAWHDTDNHALLIGGDFKQLIYSIRKEISYRISTEATVELPSGEIVNCFQQNVVALLMEMRIGAAVLNPATSMNPDDDTRFPFAVLLNNEKQLGALTVYSNAGIRTGETVLDIRTSIPDTQKFVYKEGKQVVTYDQDLSEWTDLPANRILRDKTNGSDLTVAAVSRNASLARASSVVTLEVAKSEEI